jgi:hypothetical protein
MTEAHRPFLFPLEEFPTMGKRFLVLFAVLLLVPALAADDKKPATKDDKAKHVDSDTLPNAAYTGKMLAVPDQDGFFSALVDVTHFEPKDPKHPETYTKAMQAVVHDQERLALLEHQYAAAKKPQEQVRKLKQLENAQVQLERQMEKAANDIKMVTEHKTVDFQLSRDVKVRVMALPVRFDDEGKIKAYTEDEKKALKGDNPMLPGYEAKLSDVKVNDVVRVRLWRPLKDKTTDPASDSDKDSKDAKDKGKETTPAAKKSQVTEIVILNDDKADKDKEKSKDSPGKKQ